MTDGTFTSCDQDTVTVWRSEVGFDASNRRRRAALTPYWKAPISLHLLDRRTALPWLTIITKSPHSALCSTLSLAPAPYVGALSTVLSDLLAEEGS